MKKLKQKKTSPIMIIGILLVILSSVGWVFKDYLITESPLETKIPTKKTKKHKTLPKKIISYEDRINEAKKLIEHDYFSEATIELSEAIKLKPNIIEPYLFLGEIYLQRNAIEKLDNLLVKLQDTFPNNDQIGILEARKLINEKKFSEIMTILNRTNNIPADLMFYKAVLLTLQNNHEESKKILKELEKKRIGISKSNNKDLIHPKFAKKVQEFKIVYEEFEELKEGKNSYLFAKFSKVLSQNNEAILAYEFANASIKDDIEYVDAWILRGYSEYLIKDYKNAIKDLRHAYELDTLRPEAQYFLALALTEEGFLDEASLFFEKSLEYDFEFSEEVRWKLIDILAQQKKYDEVLNLYKQLLDKETDPKIFASAVHTAIDIAKKPEMALEFTKLMIKNNPDDSFAMNIYGWSLIANKKFLEAEDVLNKLLKKDGENPRTYLNLGLLYEEKNEFDKAAKMYQKSYELGKENSKFSSLVNLAADKYNEIVAGKNKPKSPTKRKRRENSP